MRERRRCYIPHARKNLLQLDIAGPGGERDNNSRHVCRYAAHKRDTLIFGNDGIRRNH